MVSYDITPARACPHQGGAIAFGFSDLSVAVIPAEAGIQGRAAGFGALDSRFRGNDRGGKATVSLNAIALPIKGAGVKIRREDLKSY